MARLAVRLLGTLQVTLDGNPLTGFESDKERVFLAYLAEESQQPHRREKLAGLLWPERTEAAARNNLRRVLSNLRRLVGDRARTDARPGARTDARSGARTGAQSGPPFLLVTGQAVRFNPACDAWIDSLAFASLLSGSGQPSAQLEEAVLLYHGDFLEGFSVADSPACEEWIVLCRERYQRLMMEALHRLVEVYERQGRYERALELAWKELDLEPWWEEAHRQLIRLLALSGRRSEALAQYVKCRRVLAEELDVEPSPETTGLYEQIRDQALAGSLSNPQHRPGPAHNLPVTVGPFVGREAEIAEIQGYLQDPACRLLTLVGAGGMGKTRLALEAVSDWISRVREDELEGATLVSLAPLQAAEAIVPAIAQAIGLSLSPAGEPDRQLLDYLARKRWLLIFDSFEHLPDGAGFVAELLRATPTIKVLVTSRARMNLHGEYCLPVAGIAFPERIPGDARKARTFAAVDLFVQAAHRVRPGFQPDEANLAEISRICRLVQGMPLGILLAAAWLGVLAPAEIAAEIDKSLDFLKADWPDVPERQRSIRAVFDGSWSLLAEREREVFEALSVFFGGFTRAAAEQAGGASVGELRTLADRSLLQVTPSGRYQIHELLLHYAAEKLASAPDALKAARDRHCAFYIAALEGWGADLFGARQQAALVEAEAESGNIRAAWSWAVEQGQVERLDRAMEALEQFDWQSGRYREAEEALAAAAGAAEAACAAAPGTAADRTICLRVRVRALTWQSNFQRAMGQREAAVRLQQQCLAILQDVGLAGADTRLERAILAWTIGVTICMADYEQGRQRFEESLSLFRELDHRWGMARALNTSGTMSLFLGTYDQGRRRLEEGLAIDRALGNQLGIGGAVSRLACLASLEGRFAEAERLAREGVAASREAGGRTQTALALLDLGEVLEVAGRFSEAHAAIEQSLALLADLGHRAYITQAHTLLGSVELHLGRYQEAGDHAQTGLALAREHGPRFCAGDCLLLQGCLALVRGAPAMAYPLLQEGAAVYRELSQRDDLGVVLACLALSACEAGDAIEARRQVGLAFEAAVGTEAVVPRLWALPAVSLLLAGEGEVERAVELYGMASRYALVAKSRWFADVVGHRIDALATALAAERVAVLKERGQARDLQATAAELLSELRRADPRRPCR